MLLYCCLQSLPAQQLPFEAEMVYTLAVHSEPLKSFSVCSASIKISNERKLNSIKIE